MSVPAVAFFIFNRPELTRRVFERIAAARPPRLFIVADGPRSREESYICEETRRIVERIGWDCDVHRNYADNNMGCRRRVSSGLNWLFDRSETAIILEDDCLPHRDFFPYCEELLTRFRDDEQVMVISGENPHNCRMTSDSYFASRYPLIWGWATWRRAWKHYDLKMRRWRWLRARGVRHLEQWLGESRAVEYWRRVFNRVSRGEIDTWDYQWVYSMIMRRGIALVPNVNLVSNIGFGANATHTREDSDRSGRPTCGMSFPLSHPVSLLPDAIADRAALDTVFNLPAVFPPEPAFIQRAGVTVKRPFRFMKRSTLKVAKLLSR